MFKFKVEILIDEEKVIADDKYEPEVLYNYIRDMYRRFNLKEIETETPNHIIFTDSGKKTDFGALMKVTIDMYYSEWFAKYVSKCLWYNNKENKIEDFLAEAEAYCKTRKMK